MENYHMVGYLIITIGTFAWGENIQGGLLSWWLFPRREIVLGENIWGDNAWGILIGGKGGGNVWGHMPKVLKRSFL